MQRNPGKESVMRQLGQREVSEFSTPANSMPASRTPSNLGLSRKVTLRAASDARAADHAHSYATRAHSSPAMEEITPFDARPNAAAALPPLPKSRGGGHRPSASLGALPPLPPSGDSVAIRSPRPAAAADEKVRMSIPCPLHL